MGFLTAAPEDRPEFLIVASAKGKLTVTGGDNGTQHHARARVFILEDRTAVIVTPVVTPKRALTWQTYSVVNSSWSPASKLLTAELVDGGQLVLDAQGCGCNMGAVGNAGPVNGPYRLTPVRDPEWHTVT